MSGGQPHLPLSTLRYDEIASHLRRRGVTRVCDAGCGEGCGGLYWARTAAVPGLTRLLCVDADAAELARCRTTWAGTAADAAALAVVDRVVPQRRFVSEGHGGLLVEGTASDLRTYDPALAARLRRARVEAMVLCEVVEHCAVADAAALVSLAVAGYKVGVVVVTTPDADYNVHYGLAPGAFRHTDHKWEMDGPTFRAWLQGVAREADPTCTVEFFSVGGGASQGSVIVRGDWQAAAAVEEEEEEEAEEECVACEKDSALPWRVCVPALSDTAVALHYLATVVLGDVAADEAVPLLTAAQEAVDAVRREAGCAAQRSRVVEAALGPEGEAAGLWVGSAEGGAAEPAGEVAAEAAGEQVVSPLRCDLCWRVLVACSCGRGGGVVESEILSW